MLSVAPLTRVHRSEQPGWAPAPSIHRSSAPIVEAVVGKVLLAVDAGHRQPALAHVAVHCFHDRAPRFHRRVKPKLVRLVAVVHVSQHVELGDDLLADLVEDPFLEGSRSGFFAWGVPKATRILLILKILAGAG